MPVAAGFSPAALFCSGGSFTLFAVPLLPDRPVLPRLQVLSNASEALVANAVSRPPLCFFERIRKIVCHAAERSAAALPLRSGSHSERPVPFRRCLLSQPRPNLVVYWPFLENHGIPTRSPRSQIQSLGPRGPGSFPRAASGIQPAATRSPRMVALVYRVIRRRALGGGHCAQLVPFIVPAPRAFLRSPSRTGALGNPVLAASIQFMDGGPPVVFSPPAPGINRAERRHGRARRTKFRSFRRRCRHGIAYARFYRAAAWKRDCPRAAPKYRAQPGYHSS